MEHFFQAQTKGVAIAKMSQSQTHTQKNFSEQNKIPDWMIFVTLENIWVPWELSFSPVFWRTLHISVFE